MSKSLSPFQVVYSIRPHLYPATKPPLYSSTPSASCLMCLCMQKANSQRISLNRNFKSDSVEMMVSYVLLLHSITDFRCFRYVFMCMGKQNKNKQTLDCNNLHVGGTKRIEYSYEYGTPTIPSCLIFVSFFHANYFTSVGCTYTHTDTRHEQPSPEKFICSESSVRKRIHVHAKCPTLRAHTHVALHQWNSLNSDACYMPA